MKALEHDEEVAAFFWMKMSGALMVRAERDGQTLEVPMYGDDYRAARNNLKLGGGVVVRRFNGSGRRGTWCENLAHFVRFAEDSQP